MSARDELIRALETPYWGDGPEELVDAFAHELAEKIRAEEPDRWTDDYEVFQRAADLIDPEAKP